MASRVSMAMMPKVATMLGVLKTVNAPRVQKAATDAGEPRQADVDEPRQREPRQRVPMAMNAVMSKPLLVEQPLLAQQPS